MHSVQPFSHRSPRVNMSKLFSGESRLCNQRCLQYMKNHTQRRGRGCSLGIIRIRLPVHMLLQYHVRAPGKHRIRVLRDGNGMYSLFPADLHNRQKLRRPASPGSENHHISFF